MRLTGNSIAYNMLNLPRSIPGKGLSFVYDATGQKLRKINTTGAGTTTEYIGGIQYNNTAIDFVATEEGRVANNAGTYTYEYTLKDHLGNNRVTFDQTNGKVGEDDYYPFGLNAHRQLNAGNKYLYNGKELQEDFNNQYDYGARFYDPVIGRWTSVDPLVEMGQESTSPYGYVYDDPIKNTDPDGRLPDEDPPGVLSMTGNFIKGVGQSVAGTVTGVIHMVTNPAETATALFPYGLPGGMDRFSGNAMAAGSAGVDRFNNGNGDVKANMLGNLTGDLGQMFIGTGEIKAGAKALGFVKLADEAGQVAKVSGSLEKGANAVEHLSPFDLQPTHNITASKKQFANLKADIAENGIKDPINYVEHNGSKHVVNGHHRLKAAKQLGHETVPAQRVDLPHLGYKTTDDLIYTHH